MSPALARHTLVLLQRADLKGAEVPVYVQIVQALKTIIEAEDLQPSELTPPEARDG